MKGSQKTGIIVATVSLSIIAALVLFYFLFWRETDKTIKHADGRIETIRAMDGFRQVTYPDGSWTTYNPHTGQNDRSMTTEEEAALRRQ